ncbi:MAG: glutamine--tRNA ligase/YqeY domain fusion protein [Bacteroidia bacterium]|nr:glutamine--tRNA ligase/YqeY domain fusion protein [Bacteroidia bacterium]
MISNEEEVKRPLNFIEEKIEADLASGRTQTVVTRFPPEPNGYLHIGHAKSIVVNFGLAQQYGGKTNLRFDDTNPEAEDQEFVDGIMKDVSWLGYEWAGEPLYASDYFQQLYDFTVYLMKAGKAYVDDSTQEEIAAQRGIPTEPGTESPYRNRSVEENLDLLERMNKGEFEKGSKVVRAKLDMASPNMHMRDPIMYRILKAHHHRTGDKWGIYPMYDWAHGQSDAIEGISHSLCTLEFEVHRPLYDWYLDQLPPFNPRPYQTEFSRLNLNYMVMSKRSLKKLVLRGYVNGWDDPRMPTIAGLRRRGYTPASIRNFAEAVGLTRQKSITDMSFLEFHIRQDLNKTAARVMAVIDPLKVIVTNWPEGKVEWLEVENNPEDPESGSRKIPFSRELFIEAEDFMEDAPKNFFRLSPGGEVRLKGAYAIQCQDFVKDENGKVVELHCTYDPATKSGQDTTGRKIKGVLHYVSASEAISVEARLYERLFNVEDPTGDTEDAFLDNLNPDSLHIVQNVMAEPSLATAQVGDKFQFMRKGYFCVDPDSTPGKLIFNRTVTLKDSWAKSN